uniref:C-type lectin domain-containing protein n=1 Tax=Sparus aurata TaxID=8175 RepID=A0A671VU30_SPAAU
MNSAINNLTVWFDSLNKSYAALESNYTDVIAENQELETQNQQLDTQNQELETQNQQLETQNQELDTQNQQLDTQNQQLETQMKNLTDMLQDKETERNELNVSRAQWSIDQYCPIDGAVRQCKSCQTGWLEDESSCYAVNDAEPPKQRTWDGAQADCKEKISELSVLNNAHEKSWSRPEVNGYWIGLRVVDGKWTWVDGSDLTEISWIQPATPTEGHCAISVRDKGLKSMNCSETNAWICEKKALSLTPP